MIFPFMTELLWRMYEWKPGQGVRSVGDVFNLIVEENGLLADALTGKTNTGAEPAPITDPAENARRSEGFLRQSPKSDYGTFRQRPADTRETVRKRHDETGRVLAKRPVLDTLPGSISQAHRGRTPFRCSPAGPRTM